MNKSQLDRIKDKFYEAEGLLELLQLRTDKAAELAPMILTRIDEARDLMATLATDIAFSAREEGESGPGEPKVAPAPLKVETPAPEAVSDEEKTGKAAPVAPAVHAEPAPKKPASPTFCLNDHFRFRRTIFGGSEADFNAAVAHLSELNDPDAAEKYLIVETGLDPDDPDVADFLEIVRKSYAK